MKTTKIRNIPVTAILGLSVWIWKLITGSRYYLIKIFVIFTAIVLPVFPAFGAGGSLPVIPGASGYGIETRASYGGGRNPNICIVDTLDCTSSLESDTRNGIAVKTGGFYDCVRWDTDNKMVLFEVSGNIFCDEISETIYVDDSYIHVAGQTAPPPGVTIVAGPWFCAHDVVLQHLRFRYGKQLDRGNTGERPNIRRSLMVARNDSLEKCNSQAEVYNKVVDHCSISWGEDANFSIRAANDATYSNCIFGEPLHEDNDTYGNVPGRHTTAGCNANAPQGFINNVWMHAGYRSPLLDTRCSSMVLLSNNVIYNVWAHDNIGYGQDNTTAVPQKFAFVGNYLKHGNTDPNSLVQRKFIYAWNEGNPNDRIYMADNMVDEYNGGYTGKVKRQIGADDWSITEQRDENEGGAMEACCKVTEMPFPYPDGYQPMPSSQIVDYLAANAGAFPMYRDPVDARNIREMVEREGRRSQCVKIHPSDPHCDTASEVVPEQDWPYLEEKYRRLELPSDPHSDDDNDGYTNLEEWLHGFTCQVEGPGSPSCLSSCTPDCSGLICGPSRNSCGTCGACASGEICDSSGHCVSGQNIPGDLNQDSRVDVIDLGILLSAWGATSRPPADFNQDGQVNVIDLGILLGNWG